MTERYLCSSMSKKAIRFKVQIGSYSMYICKGYYASPEFGDDDDSECKWSLLVHAYDGADHENFIDVHLKKDDYASGELFVKVKISIISCIGINVFKNERKFSFSDNNEARILAVAKAQLKGLFGLKKFFYLPNDTLTLQCDLEVMRENDIQVASYKDKASFLSDIPLEVSTSECFSHSRILKEEDDFFCWKIRNFAVQTNGGSCVSPVFQSDRLGDKWNLVLYNTHDDDYYGECIDIRLKRRESYEKKLFNAKLSLFDPFGNILKSEEKNVYFTRPEGKQLMCVTDRDLVSWFGKKNLVQDDTLTLRCDLLSYKQIDDNFRTEEDFTKSIETHGYTPKRFIMHLAVICLVLLSISYVSYLNLMVFNFLSILEMIKTMLIFVVPIALIWWFGLKHIKEKAENIIRSYSKLQLIKHLALFTLFLIVAFHLSYPAYIAVLNIRYLMLDITEIIKRKHEVIYAIIGIVWLFYCDSRETIERERKNKNRRKQNVPLEVMIITLEWLY